MRRDNLPLGCLSHGRKARKGLLVIAGGKGGKWLFGFRRASQDARRF